MYEYFLHFLIGLTNFDFLLFNLIEADITIISRNPQEVD